MLIPLKKAKGSHNLWRVHRGGLQLPALQSAAADPPDVHLFAVFQQNRKLNRDPKLPGDESPGLSYVPPGLLSHPAIKPSVTGLRAPHWGRVVRMRNQIWRLALCGGFHAVPL